MLNKGRNYSVDAIKGLMILLIILHHSQLLPFLHHGYLGVDVFFIISGYYLMRHFSQRKENAIQYTLHRVKAFYLPYLLALALACVLDYKHLTSFQGFEGFVETYAPFLAFLTLTEEMGFIFHAPVILVGGWFLSVLVIGGFLLYGLLEYNEKFTLKVFLPFGILLGFSYLFSKETSIENFSVLNAISFPLLRGFLEMGTGVLLFQSVQELIPTLQHRKVLVMVLSLLAFAVFVIMVLAEKSLDCFFIIVIPLMLLGALTPESILQSFYDRFPSKILATIGALSLEAYLIHQPILHIIHSSFTHLGLPVRPVLLVPLDLCAVFFAAFLLRKICKWIKKV